MSYLVYDPLDGDHQEIETLEGARKEAKDLIQSIYDACDGWPQEVECNGVKIYKLVEQSVQCDVMKREDYSEEDWSRDPDWPYMCNYKMESELK